MNYRELVAGIKAGRIERVYVFTGKETYLREDALARIKKKLLPEELSDFNCTELTNPAVQDVIACAETLPVMAERRLLVVREFALLSGEDKKGKANDKLRVEGSDRESEALIRYLSEVPDSTCIVFLAGDTVDRRKKLGKLMAALPGFVSFDPPDDAELIRFLSRIARLSGLAIDQSAAERLIFYSGRDLALLSQEMEKLIAYVGEEKCILPEHVDAVATRTIEARVFDMIDAAVFGETNRAFGQLTALIATGEARLGILALLIRQLRQMLYISDMFAAGKKQIEIAEAMQVKPFVVDRLERRTRRIPKEKIRNLLSLSIQTEFNVKSGVIREDAGLEQLLLRLSDLRI